MWDWDWDRNPAAPYGGRGERGERPRDERPRRSYEDRGYDRPRDYAVDYGSESGGPFGTTRMPDTGRPSFRGRGPKNFERSDERLHELVCERLTDDDEIDASEIDVSVSNGDVTLSGTVDDRRTRRLAEDVAESVRGVKNVLNNLKVDRSIFAARDERPRR